MADFIQYPKIYAFGHDETKDIFKNKEDTIVIQEKIDGANFRFMFNKGNIIFGSRTQQLTSSTGEDVNISKNFRRCVQHIKNQVDKKLIKKYDRYIFFGENCVKHSISYDWEKIPPFLGFDIFDIEEERMLDYVEAKEIYKDLKLEFVPIVKIVKAGDITEVNESMIPISIYTPRANPNLQAEGVVFKNYGSGLMAKIVTENFKEINAETFGGIPKYEENDTGKIVATYCTNARIEKLIFKLIDGGGKLELSMMSKLPRMVFNDIFEENWSKIINKYQDIKPRDIKRYIAKRCLAVLNQIIINNALSGEER